MALLIHHHAWLRRHKHRTAEWLQKQLSEGFDMHHLDGDHDNNDPNNLLLIEGADHQALLHGLKFVRALYKNNPEMASPAWLSRWASKGQIAYEMRKAKKPWREISKELGATLELTESVAMGRVACLAKGYAKTHGLLWPLPKPAHNPQGV